MLTFAMVALMLVSGFAQKPVEAVRGVWLTNVDSDVLNSRENIKQAIERCYNAKINSIFVVTWNKGYTLYPSAVMKKTFGEEIDPLYVGRDPLQELIEEAHKKDIKVIAWFEYGFAASFKENGGRVLAKFPHWAAIDNKGKLATKNSFEWMNGFLPEVQDFILSLIAETVRNYKVDGIQGDDRLPAMPSLAGYDEYTVSLYKKEHNGAEPPNDYKESAWVQWRADLMTDFLGRIYDTVKTINPNCLVTMAPSIYPWAKEEYLQDWPEWLKRGWAEMILPQCYRYNMDAYKIVIDDIYDHQLKAEFANRVFPGVLLKVGSYYPDEEFLREMIAYNRKRGALGEVYFFYEGLKKYPELFNNLYGERATFPHLLHKK